MINSNRIIFLTRFTLVVHNGKSHVFRSTSDVNSLVFAVQFIESLGLTTSNFEAVSAFSVDESALLAKHGFDESGDPLPEKPAEQPVCKLNHNKPCRICGKTSFKTPKNCANPVNSLSGGWQCQLNREFVGTALVTRQDFIVQYRGGRL